MRRRKGLEPLPGHSRPFYRDPVVVALMLPTVFVVLAAFSVVLCGDPRPTDPAVMELEDAATSEPKHWIAIVIDDLPPDSYNFDQHEYGP